MAKSIIQIDVDDKAFKEHLALFNKYQEKLKGVPKAWGEVGKQTEGIQGAFTAIVAATFAQTEMLKKVIKGEKEAVVHANALSKASRELAQHWSGVARSTGLVALNIGRATRDLLKWSAVAGIFSGLVGAGGIYGLDRLASGVGANRRSSLGTGLSYGEQSAFDVNYSRVVDSRGFLSSVNEALHDVTKRASFAGAGLAEGDLTGSTGEVGSRLLQSLKKIADQTPDYQLAQVFQARRLDQFMGLQDFQRLKATPAGELQGYASSYERDRRTLDLQQATQKAWQDFAVQMTRAGETIENVFVKGLTPLIHPLDELSASVTRALGTLLSSPHLGEWLEAFGKGIERAAGYIGGDKFQVDVVSFADGVGAMASAIAGFVGWARAHLPSDWFGSTAGSGGYKVSSFAREDIGPAGQRQATLDLIRQLEGSGDSAVSSKGAVGRYQITPDTARTYGFNPARLSDPTYNEMVARAIVADLDRKYGGQTAEELVAYNAGPRVADRFKAAGDNLDVLPAETQKYLTNAMKLTPGGSQVIIRIENNTGGNSIVTTSQVAQ